MADMVESGGLINKNTQSPHSTHGKAMSITQAEKLKVELTDKWVVVADQIPELRRFAALTGKVKTVNMNCRALVEFDGVEDISWYDIDPQFLTVVDGPRPKAEVTHQKTEAPKAAAPKAGAKPAGANPLDAIRAGGGAAKPAAGGSPLDAIRSGGGGAAKPAAGGSPLDAIRAGGGGAAKPSAGGSPLDAIRASGAASEKAVEPAAESEVKPVEKNTAAAKPAATGSPLDQIRASGAFKK